MIVSASERLLWGIRPLSCSTEMAVTAVQQVVSNGDGSERGTRQLFLVLRLEWSCGCQRPEQQLSTRRSFESVSYRNNK